MRSKLSASILVAAMLAALGIVSACETMEGAGRDIQSGGEAIEDTSEDVQE